MEYLNRLNESLIRLEVDQSRDNSSLTIFGDMKSRLSSGEESHILRENDYVVEDPEIANSSHQMFVFEKQAFYAFWIHQKDRQSLRQIYSSSKIL